MNKLIRINLFKDVVVEMGSHSNWRVRQSVLNALSVMSFPSEIVGNLVSAMLKDEASFQRRPFGEVTLEFQAA